MKFTLIGEHLETYSSSKSKCTVEFEGGSLDEILRHVDYFLKGCSFVPKGDLQYCEQEDYVNLDDIKENMFEDRPKSRARGKK